MRVIRGCVAVVLFLILGTFNTVLAADWDPLPDTGQTDCYDVDGAVIFCPGEGEALYGQDGNYSGPTPYYQGNGDGTVTDMHTNLMWQQGTKFGGTTWQQAIDYCATLQLAGHGDWRLPERMELKSIINYSKIRPACDAILQCVSGPYSHSNSYFYWSATIDAVNNTQGWAIDYREGGDRFYSKASSMSVRCVRAGL